MNYTIIIQARVGSTRRPGKVIEIFNNEELLSFQVKRLKASGIENIVVATTENIEDNIIEKICSNLNVKCFRGSAVNLIERYAGAIKKYNVDILIRVGGDDPLIDPQCIHALIKQHMDEPADFIYASHKFGWIYGTAAELIDAKIIAEAVNTITSDLEKEHIIPYIKGSDKFKKVMLYPKDKETSRQDIFLSVDYQEDLDIVCSVLSHFNQENKLYSFTQKELIELIDSGLITMNNKHLQSGFDLT